MKLTYFILQTLCSQWVIHIKGKSQYARQSVCIYKWTYPYLCCHNSQWNTLYIQTRILHFMFTWVRIKIRSIKTTHSHQHFEIKKFFVIFFIKPLSFCLWYALYALIITFMARCYSWSRKGFTFMRKFYPVSGLEWHWKIDFVKNIFYWFMNFGWL